MANNVTEDGERLSLLDGATVREVMDAINKVLKDDPLAMEGMGETDGLDVFPTIRYRQHEPLRGLYPGMRWIAAWAARGSNEGWYVHVEAVCQGTAKLPADLRDANVSRIIYLGKGFGGMRAAAHAAARISELLEEWDG